MTPTCSALSLGWTPTTVGELVASGVDQGGPTGDSQFLYVDISAIDNSSKRITQSRWLPVSDAPTRARQRVQIGDVLVSMTRPNLNAVGIVGTEHQAAVASTGFHVLRACDGVQPRWLFYLVQTTDFVRAMSGLVLGVLYPAVRPKDIRSYPVLLPPTPEQDRIVAEIERHFTRLDAAAAALKRVQANLKRYRAAVLKAAVEGRLVPSEAELAQREGREYEAGEQLLQRIRRGREQRHRRLPEREAQLAGSQWINGGSVPVKLPSGWVLGVVDELCDAIDYGTSSKTDAAQSGVPVLRMGNIVDGLLVLDSLKYLPPSHPEFPDLLLCAGDVLFNRTNSPELVGKSAVYRGQPTPCSFASYLIRVRLADGCLPDTLSNFINSTYGRRWISSVVVQQVGQANVNGSKLRALALPLPPYGEQVRIASEVDRRLSMTDQLRAQAMTSLLRVERLKQAILNRAYDGRLIQQDPRDEPASVLLDRIGAERSASAGRPASSRRGSRQRRASGGSHPAQES